MKNETAWQLKLFNKTLKKKEKLKIIRSLLPPLSGRVCLDLGCAKGSISYFLRKEGGFWVHEDLDFSNVLATNRLVGNHTVVIPSTALPHPDDTFDVIIALDILEHLHDDIGFLREIRRVLKPGGRFVLSTPATGRMYLLNRLKNTVGLTPDQYGHVVEGYTLKQLESMLATTGFTITKATTYSRFFTEFVEFMINFVFITFLRKETGKQNRSGYISPGGEEDIKKYRKQLRIYSLIYPFVWLLTRLDKLLFWQKGYATLLVAS